MYDNRSRVLKTGLAVALAIFVSELLGFSSPLIAAVAAIFTIQRLYIGHGNKYLISFKPI